VKLVKGRIESTLAYTGIGSNFLNRIPIAQQFRERIDKWDCIKPKNFCTAKEIVIRLKRQLREWEKNCCQLYI
jgi:hypothetical protein